jgi:hypothetical protein
MQEGDVLRKWVPLIPRRRFRFLTGFPQQEEGGDSFSFFPLVPQDLQFIFLKYKAQF